MTHGEHVPAAGEDYPVYTFGKFELDTGRGTLISAGQLVRLRPKSFEVLRYLLEHSGRLVSRDELFQAVWAPAVVTDGAMDQCFIDIRRALGAEGPDLIETVPRRGYRLRVQVQRRTGHSDERRPAIEAGPGGTTRSLRCVTGAAVVVAGVMLAAGLWFMGSRAPSVEDQAEPFPARSIAVLPFANVGSEPNQQFLADGLSEELISLLARNPGLKVTSRTSAFHFKNRTDDLRTIARELGVAHVLEGSVRKSGDAIRVTVQLIEAETDSHVWSETYDRTLGDVFALQDEIAASVFEKLKVTLLEAVAARRTPDLVAYMRYLEGRRLLELGRPDVVREARVLLEEAVVIDPEFVRGWTELVRARGLSGDAADAMRALEIALELDPDDPVANAWLGWPVFRSHSGPTDLEIGAARFRRALRTDATHVDVLRPMVFLLMRLGRLSEAESVARWLLSTDPLCVICRSSLGLALHAAGRFTEAEQELGIVMTLAPVNVGHDYFLALSQVLRGEPEAALITLQRSASLVGPLARWLNALARYELGDTEIVPQTLAELESGWDENDPTVPAVMALGYTLTGDHDAAFAWLERSVAFPADSPTYPHLTHGFAPLHDDPRWTAMLERLGLHPEQLARIELDFTLPQR